VAPRWLTALAWCYLGICFVCAGVIAYDIVFDRRRQPMGVMNFVFPITALYFGPLALAFYWHWGRPPSTQLGATMSMSPIATSADASLISRDHHAMHDRPHQNMVRAEALIDRDRPSAPAERRRPGWVTMAVEVSHCGSGCTIGDVIAEFAVFWLALTIAGSGMAAEYVSDYALALIFGIMFQYFAIAPMRHLGLKDGLVQATKADFVSLTAFEIGLFSWMAVMAYILFPAPHRLTPASAAFWLLMQVGMMIGFSTSWPANVWLVKRGIKVPM
jgi:Domain of unknown function (DUF4396)